MPSDDSSKSEQPEPKKSSFVPDPVEQKKRQEKATTKAIKKVLDPNHKKLY